MINARICRSAIVQEFLDAGVDFGDAIFVEHGDEVALADLTGADQRVEIALLIAARPDIGEDQVHDVVARFATVPDLDRRDAQAFGVDFVGVGL